ncbi:multisubunit sodium/proton antiporter, MrpF subunit [Kytococcus aerolatus]|uniref:Multisubunit sodium/proton antiporter, MrpF subunit n=1 Tax=Kytococcus aerolatus TaxID=592308 RepID=A0A212T5B4_9MICO|nr:monovalent cation/H+ antiporter complex subunit F [Kytococcus aerolatus]SNC61026.1 multisubunit sodium/proton antiporter, MrpF subunit [Kytococcus aerolatus]
MDALTVLLAVSAGVLVLASALALYRIAAGPTALDRIVASDVLVSVLLGMFCLVGAWWRLPQVVTVLMSLALVAFLGGVAVARYAARDRDSGWARDDRVDMSADGRPS